MNAEQGHADIASGSWRLASVDHKEELRGTLHKCTISLASSQGCIANLGGFEEGLGINLSSTQRSSRVCREEGVACASTKDHDHAAV